MKTLELLRPSGISGYIERRFFIFDEAKDHLSKNIADLKCSKRNTLKLIFFDTLSANQIIARDLGLI